jgi:hypothetical protein
MSGRVGAQVSSGADGVPGRPPAARSGRTRHPARVRRTGPYGGRHDRSPAGAAALGAIIATGLLNVLLLLWAPKPYLFFGWILGLAVVIATLMPYAFDAERGSKVATSAINLAIGVCSSSILEGVGRSAAQLRDRSIGY